MFEALKYFIRLFASVILLGLAAVFCLFASLDAKATAAMYGIGAVFGLAGLLSWPRRPNAWRRDPPTERQLAYARDLGISIPKGISKGELSDLITAFKS
jgi:hypothetical protein